MLELLFSESLLGVTGPWGLVGPGIGEPQVPVTFSPVAVTGAGNLRPTSSVLPRGCPVLQACSPPSSIPGASRLGVGMWGCWGVESGGRTHHWVLSPCSPSSLRPWTQMQGKEAPSPAPGVFPGQTPVPQQGGGSCSTEQRLGEERGSGEQRKEGAEHALKPPLHELPPCPSPGFPVLSPVWVRVWGTVPHYGGEARPRVGA